MQVKSYNHQSVAEWSNSKLHSQLLACAQINPDQNNMYNLDILSLDLSDRSKNLNVIGNAFYNVPFRCLAWDTFGQKQNTFTHGVIFAGMEDGSYTLWNTAQMISSYNRNPLPKTDDNIQNQLAFLYGQQAEEGSYPIMCAEWNALKNNYLAFGSTDLLILDIGKDIANPEIKKPGNRNPHEGSYITSVAWNKEVANILASASQNGLIALWDIKSNKSIFEFKDSPSSNVENRNVVICWSKTISTQLAVTLDDEKRNQLQIWDLRNQKGPVAVFDRGHTKGINTMQWCETDPDLILTAGRDNRVVCWNYTQEEGPISNLQLNQPIFDLKWSKKLKSIYSLSLQDKTQIYTMDNTNLFSYVPKWYRVPIESSFCGNESLIRYTQGEGQKLTQIKLSNLPHTETTTVHSLLKELQSALDQNSQDINGSQSEFWKLISIKKASHGDDPIYEYLGFNREKIIKEVQKYTGKKRQNLHVKTQTQNKHKAKAYTPVIGLEAASFFASIGQNQVKSSGNNNQEDEENQSVKYDMVPRNFNWNIGKERLIKHNILIGNYEGAIDAALKCGRTAEALIIAYSLDQNAFNSTLKQFFTETTDNFITDILKNITSRDNEELVRKYDLDNWKECVAMIYSLSTSEKRKHLLNLLASRIREESLRKTGKLRSQVLSEDNPAILCYVLSENFNQIANLYFDNLKTFDNRTVHRKQAVLQYAKRLILIFNSLTVDIQPCKSFQKIVRQAAFIATEQNFKMIAYLIFSNYVYETSMKEVDMIIHATKNLEEYRNSIVFKQINIPVMQVKETQQTQPQRGKKQANDQHVPPKMGQQTQSLSNPNVPTKDKNAPRPPIFNKKQQVKEQTKQGNFPPQHNIRGRNQSVHTEEEEEEQPQQQVKKTPQRKMPPPPGFKPQGQTVAPTYQQHGSQQYQPETTHTSFQQTERKVPPPGTSKKVPPPPPTHFATEQKQPQTIQHSQQLKKPLPRQTQSTRLPPPSHQRTPPPPQQQNRIPPPVTRSVRQQPPQQHYEQQQAEDYQQRKGQQFYQQPHVPQTRSLKQPPPMTKPPMLKQQNERQEQNMSFQSHKGPEVQTFNKQPEFHSAKKNVPPPPGKREILTYEEQPETVSRTKLQVVKPPPPTKGRVPPPPPPTKLEPPPIQRTNPQQFTQQPPPHYIPQQHTQHTQQQHQHYEEPVQRQTQYETPVIKRPPPPVTGKKVPPPPPRR